MELHIKFIKVIKTDEFGVGLDKIGGYDYKDIWRIIEL